MATTWETIKGAVEEVGADILSLDVVTLTGNITITSGVKDNKIDLQELYKAVEAAASTAATIDLIAFTHVELDADSVNFVKKDLTPEQKGLLAAHAEAVKSAQETRAGIVAMIRSFFP